MVSELVGFALLRFDHKPVSTRPVLSVNDGFELPQLVGSVNHHQVFCLFVSDMRAEVLHLFKCWHSGAHASECQTQRTRPLNHTLQFLCPTNENSFIEIVVTLYVHDTTPLKMG